MPEITRPDGAIIHYEVFGSGYPLLLIARGGVNSEIAFWERSRINPVKEFAGEFMVIDMDQRHAGKSGNAPAAFSSEVAAADQVAVLDHARVARARLGRMHWGGLCPQPHSPRSRTHQRGGGPGPRWHGPHQLHRHVHGDVPADAGAGAPRGPGGGGAVRVGESPRHAEQRGRALGLAHRGRADEKRPATIQVIRAFLHEHVRQPSRA